MTVPSGVMMIVSADPDERAAAARLVQAAGHIPLSAGSGAQALARLRGCQVDLVLLAAALPDLDARQMLEKLKADEALRALPVLVMAAANELELAEHCLQQGAQDYVAKPDRPVLFMARVHTWLEKKYLLDHEQVMLRQLAAEKRRAEELLDRVIPLGVAFSAERDFNRLLERILLEAQQICRAEGGTLYLRVGEALQFEILRNDTLHLALGGTTGQPARFAPLPLWDEAGRPNHHMVATYAALAGISVNIVDAYTAEGFDFSGARAFDEANAYRSQSILAVPLKDATNTVIGVLQLINAREPGPGRVTVFEPAQQRIVEALSALAAAALKAYLREQRLQQQLDELRIEIDEVRRAAQVAEITETEYFRRLQEKARRLRQKKA